MKKNLFFYYIVEGETEKKLIEILKTEKKICLGKIKILNVIQTQISQAFLRTLEPNTIVVLIFDTDIKKKDILEENIVKMKKNKNIKEIIFIPQILNLEDEIIYATNVNQIEELLGSSSKKDFKNDFNSCSNIYSKLISKKFNISKIWTRNCTTTFKKFKNTSFKIKK